MKKIYSLLSMLLLATALQAATNLEPSDFQVASVSATPDDGDQEGYYNLTVNVNATDTTLANIKILLRSDGSFGPLVYKSDLDKYTELTNHTSIALPRGNYYIALMSTKVNSSYYNDMYSILVNRKVQLSSDKDIDLNYHILTVDFDLPEGAEDRFFLAYDNTIRLYNHNSIEVFEGTIDFGIYDKNNGYQISNLSCNVTSDQTVTIPFHTLTVSTNASEEVMKVSDLRVYWDNRYYTIENNGCIVLPEDRYTISLIDKDLGTVIQSKEFTLESDQTVTLNKYNLTANLNARNIDNYLLVYSSDLYYVTDYYGRGQRAATIENHSSILLGEGQTIYVGVVNKETQETFTYKEVVMDSDQTVDFDINQYYLTVNLTASQTENLILIYSKENYCITSYYSGRAQIIDNHSTVAVNDGVLFVGVYDTKLERTITYEKVEMNSDKTVNFKLNKVSLNISAPEQIINKILINESYKNNDNFYLPDGDNIISVDIPNYDYDYYGNSSYKRYKSVNVMEDITLDIKINKLSIVCRDKDGNIAPQIKLNIKSQYDISRTSQPDYFGEDYQPYRTDNNGRVDTYYLGGDTIRISIDDNNCDVSNYIVIMNGDKDVIITIPNKISFKLLGNRKPLTWVRFYSFDNKELNYEDDYNGNYTLRYDGKNPLRLWVGELYGTSEDCDEGFVAGYFSPINGSTVRVASVSVQSNGNGLVFPRNDFQPQKTYKMFVGNVVRLAALPVGDTEFINWNINGKVYSQPMIDYTVMEDDVTAIAFFSSEISSNVKGVKAPTTEQITVSIEGGTLRLPEFIEGDASFYSVDGRLVKQVGVVGDRIVISDLPAGAYVLTIGVEGRTLSARFVKP